MVSARGPHYLHRVVGIASLLGSFGAFADSGMITLQPSLLGSLDYSTNPQLRIDGARSGYSAGTEVGLPAYWETGTRHLELAPKVRLAASGGDSAVGSEGYYVGGGIEDASERGSLRLHGNWNDDSAAAREPTAGTLTRVNIRRLARDVSLSGGRTISERWQSQLAVAAEAVDYGAGAAGTGLQDYRDSSASGQLNFNWTERTQWQGSASIGRYRAPAIGYEQSSINAQLGISAELSARTSYRLSYGWSRARAVRSDAQSSGAIYLATLEHHGELWAFSLSASQTLQPSGYSSLVRAREFMAREDWQTTERFASYATIRYVETADFFRQFTIADRNYTAAAIGGVWQATPLWNIRAVLTWQRQGIRRTLFGPAAEGQGSSCSINFERRFEKIRLM